MKKHMMKNILIILLFAFCYSLSAQTAKIKVDVDRIIGEIDPRIYGVFMEPINFSGRRMGLPDSVKYSTLYGPLYDPSSPLADENGFCRQFPADHQIHDQGPPHDGHSRRRHNLDALPTRGNALLPKYF